MNRDDEHTRGPRPPRPPRPASRYANANAKPRADAFTADEIAEARENVHNGRAVACITPRRRESDGCPLERVLVRVDDPDASGRRSVRLVALEREGDETYDAEVTLGPHTLAYVLRALQLAAVVAFDKGEPDEQAESLQPARARVANGAPAFRPGQPRGRTTP